MDAKNLIYIGGGLLAIFLIYKYFPRSLIDTDKLFAFLFGEKEAKKRKAKRAEKEGNIEEAAKLYEELGDNERAAKLYLENGLPLKAAMLFENIGDYERAAKVYSEYGNYQRAADLYLNKMKDLDRAVKLLIDSNRFQEAAELYYKAKKYKEAGELYEKTGFYIKAGKCFEQLGGFERAAKNYEKWLEQNLSFVNEIGEREKRIVRKIIDLYVKTNNITAAVELARTLKWYELAGEIAEKGGLLEKAAEFYEEARLQEKAAEVYRRLGKTEKAEVLLGEHFLTRGEYLKAAEHFERGKDYSRAAELYEWNKEPYKAAVCYEKDGLFAKAGELYLFAGAVEEAVDNFEKAGEFARAAEALKKLSDLQKDEIKKEELLRRTIELYKKGKKWFEAGSIAYYDLNDHDLTIEYLQKVEPDDPNFEKASYILGKLFFDKKEYDLAEERFQAALGGSTISKSNLDIYYKLGVIAQEKGEYRKAYKIFKSITSLDIHYLDSKERMEKLSSMVQELQKIEEMASTPGDRYKIIEKIGKGGMGTVYKAEDKLLNRVVALKLLNPMLNLDKRAFERFIAEARTAAKLSHPNIVIVYDVGRFNDRFFIAMEFLEGQTLLEYLKLKGGFTIRQILFIATKLFSALQYAHKNGVIHRDIKPQNIMLTRDRKIKVMDFGLAVIADEIEKEKGRIAGTPFYMSPEQCKGLKVDARSDIYSAGATLYHLIVKRPVITGKTREEIIRKQIEELPTPPSAYRKDIPPELEEFILKCLAKERNRRFQSADEALEALKIITKKIM